MKNHSIHDDIIVVEKKHLSHLSVIYYHIIFYF